MGNEIFFVLVTLIKSSIMGLMFISAHMVIEIIESHFLTTLTSGCESVVGKGFIILSSKNYAFVMVIF